MTQQQLDYLCINQQTSIGLRSANLVHLARTGDLSLPAMTANLMASHALMKAIKDLDIVDEVLTDQEIFNIQDKLIQLEKLDEQYY